MTLGVHIATGYMDARGRFVLDRAIRRAGFAPEQFDWSPTANTRCTLALGDHALTKTTGMAGAYRNVNYLTNWVIPGLDDKPVVPCFEPVWIRAGHMAFMSVLMHNIKLAVAVARAKPGQRVVFHSPVLNRDFEWVGMGALPSLSEPLSPAGYVTHPSEEDALGPLRAVEADPTLLLAYDIETPRSAKVDEDESDELSEIEILSIQFSVGAESGVFMPWRAPFVEVARRLLASPNPKACANGWRFDNPILEAHGFALGGVCHDVRWAWHHLNPDLKSSLQFIASFYEVQRGPWKMFHNSHESYYGIRDVSALHSIMGGSAL